MKYLTYLLTSCLLFGIIGCKTISELWVKNPETGELELEKKIVLQGTGKNKADFNEKKEKIENDSGFELKTPDIELDVDKIRN